MFRYLVLFTSSFIIEVASTMYISTVSERSIEMLFWAFIGPFLGLPFVAFMVEAKNWNERLKFAFCSATGYTVGSLLVFLTR